jgi:hypothetical protein
MKRKKTSFLKQLLKDSWVIAVEHAKYMKAMRILQKQEWSIEFLTMLLNRSDRQLTLVLKNAGNEILITKTDSKPSGTSMSERDLMEYLHLIPEQKV